MPKIDRHSYLYNLQTKGLIYDWLPFEQSEYIKRVLHDDIPSKSPQGEGVCSAMCYYVIKRWISDGVSVDAVGELERQAVAEGIVDYMEAEGGDSTAYFEQQMTQHMYRQRGKTPYIGYKQPIEATTQQTDFCLTGWINTTEENGHAIICNCHPNFAIFDPNVGYLRAYNQTSYTWAFLDLMKTFYPEYCGANAGANVVRFSKVGG